MKNIKSVKILPGCVSCGTCEAMCPEVFEIRDVSKVKEGIDLEKNKECIEQASKICPVGVIEIGWGNDQPSE